MSEDALIALRNAVKSKSKIKLLKDGREDSNFISATDIQLASSVTLPKSTPSRLRKPGTSSDDPQVKPDDFISLGAVYLSWILKGASAADYMKQLRENGISLAFVPIADRKAVVEWLEGKRSELPNAAPLTVSTTPPGSPRATGASIAATPSSASAKRKYVTDVQDLEVVKKIRLNEIELQDRNTVLRGSKPNNFSNFQKSYAEKIKQLKAAAKGGPTAASPSKSPDPKAAQRKGKHNYPIIMISSSPTSLITMYNVKRFLEDAAFEPSADAKARAIAEGNGRVEDMIPIYRKKTQIGPGGKEIVSKTRYFVVDGVDALSKFGADAWDRVICVMTTGQAWQFRPYKWSDPRQLFHHVKGVYVAWSSDPPNPKIQDWNVTELKIDPHRRHTDKSIVAHLWKILDTWTTSNKPWLTM